MSISDKNKKRINKVEHGLMVFLDIYIMIILVYAALVIANLLPAHDKARVALVVSLGTMATVRLVVGLSRSRMSVVE